MKNFKRLVAGTIAATMALAMSVSAFAEVEVKDAVNATYADGKAAYTETITAKDGTQMTVAIFKALDQDEDLSAEKLEYINQDVNTALNLSAMGTKNNLLAEDDEGNATYAGDYVIRVGYYDADNAWQYAEGTFTVATKAAAAPVIVYGDVDGYEGITAGDATTILQHCAQIVTLTGDLLTASDVDGYDGITAGDATTVLQYCAQIVPSLPVVVSQ